MITEPPTATGTRRERSMIGAARIVACVLAFAGIVGLVRVGTTGETQDLATLLIAPATAAIWFVIGIAGIALSVHAGRARAYLIVVGAFLTLWGVVGVVTQGASDVLTNDPSTVALLLVLGIGALGVALGPTPDFVETALALPDAEADEEGGPAAERPPPGRSV
ncbi:MAG TPA: hypothetical protein PKD59_12340 [Miltoncostaeaceae bacterium]|nr:hypothetical protein [Miltoncostaeaceae bacterium]